jgi:rhamnosyltransferase
VTHDLARVGAVFSAFRPDTGLVRTIGIVVSSVARVIVVDDGSGSGYDDIWDSLRAAGADVVQQEVNAGIAVALNRGIRSLLDDGCDAVVTFDQDSEPAPDLISRLVDELGRASAADAAPVAFIVPETFAGVSQVHVARDGMMLARHVIQSGMLVPRTTFERVGLLRDDLFIDLVDTEFELRCARAGMSAFAAPGTALGHQLGRSYVRTLAGRPVRIPGLPDTVAVSTPFRYYYRVRNRRVINREYFRSYPWWVTRDSIRELVHYVNVLMIARPRRSLSRLYLSGWRDGRRGRRGGRMPAGLAQIAAAITWAAPIADRS